MNSGSRFVSEFVANLSGNIKSTPYEQWVPGIL